MAATAGAQYVGLSRCRSSYRQECTRTAGFAMLTEPNNPCFDRILGGLVSVSVYVLVVDGSAIARLTTTTGLSRSYVVRHFECQDHGCRFSI